MKCAINLIRFQRFDEGTEDTVQTMAQIVRLPYAVHSIDTRGLQQKMIGW